MLRRNTIAARLVTVVTLLVSLLGPLVVAPQLAYAAPDGSDIDVKWYGAEPGSYSHLDGVGGDSGDVVTSLEGGDFACGDRVLFFAVVDIADDATEGASTATFNFNLGWEGTNGGQAGFRILESLTIDPTDSQAVGDNDNSTITAFSATPTPAVNPDNLVVSATISDLEAGETIIIRILAQLVCAETVGVTNIQTSWAGGTVVAGGSGVIGGGAQTVSLQTRGLTYYDPVIVTTVSSPTTQPGVGVTDTAIVSGPVGIPAPAGTVTFFVCGPTAAPESCTTGGTQVGSAVTLVTNQAVSASFAPTVEGVYCFRAEYTPASGSPYNPGIHTNDTTECFTVEALRGTITIVKDATPNSAQSFAFTGDLGAFSLTDDGTNPNSTTFANLTAGTYAVTETALDGWDLVSLVCTDPDSGSSVSLATRTVTIDLDPGETVTCTFGNTQRGKIIVDKVTIPGGDPAVFTFDPSWSDTNFTLTDAATPHDSGWLVSGTYSVVETVPAGWDLSSATCSDGSPVTAIAVAPGETVTCTFTNTKRQDLTVTKTATATYDRTYLWTIDKSVDGSASQTIASGLATFGYNVAVAQAGYSDSGWTISGTITVSNPNTFAVSGVTVFDSYPGGFCVVTSGASVTVPAAANGVPGSVTLNYSCTFGSQPAYSGTNTATATWDNATWQLPSSSATGTAAVTFTRDEEINKTITVVDDKVDQSPPVVLGQLTATDAAPFTSHTYEYDLSFAGTAGTCTNYTNTATIQETEQSDSQTVTVCRAQSLTVSKTATAALVRTHTWDITKTADPTELSLFAGGSAAVGYTVAVDKTTTDSAWVVSGQITVDNPNNWAVTLVDITDSIDDGGVCTVTAGLDITIPAGGSVVRTYVCTFASNPGSGTNTATATWPAGTGDTPYPAGTASGTAGYDFGQATITTVGYDAVSVTDTNGAAWGPVSADTSWTYTETLACSRDVALYAGDGHYQYTHPNTATIDETGQADDASVTVDCYAPQVSKTAQTTYTRTWAWTIDKTADATTLSLGFWQPGTVTYAVTVNGTPTDGAWAVAGVITVANPNPDAAMTVSLSDMVSGGIAATIAPDADCAFSTGTLVVPAGGTATCPYSAPLPDGTARTNTATATLNGLAFSGSAAVTFGAPTSVVDETVEVTDDQQGVLGTLTGAGSSATETWTYAKQVGPYAACTVTSFVNTATFVANDTGATGSDTWTVAVRVKCDAVCDCTRTTSYWLQHAEPGGRRGYDRTWDLIGPQGSATTFFKSPYTYKMVLMVYPSGSTAVYYSLGQQYIAAYLNVIQGASAPPEVIDALLSARSIFEQYTPAQVGSMSSEQKAELQSLTNTLYRYNMGYIGPGRCR